MRVETHWPLLLGLLLIAGFGGWVFIHSNRSYLLRWALIPVSLVVAVLSARVYDAGLGYAAAAELPEKFVYLGHHVVEKKRKAGIDVWAQTEGTRLYRNLFQADRASDGQGPRTSERRSAGREAQALRRSAIRRRRPTDAIAVGTALRI